MIDDEELRNLYKSSSEEHLQALESGLRYLQSQPDDATILQELRREAHSLKGDSRSVGVEPVETLADCIGKILLSLSRQEIALTSPVSDCPRGTSVADRLFQGLVAIEKLVEEAVSDRPSGVDTAEVFNQLMAAVSQAQESQPDVFKENGNFPVAARSFIEDVDTPETFNPLMVAVSQAQESQLDVFGENGNPSVAALSFIEDEELRNLYQTSSEEHLQQLEVGLRHLQMRPDDEVTLELLRWEAHSLKGDSRSVGLEQVESLTHCVEKILISLSHQQIVLTQQVSEPLFQALAAINLLIQEAVTGQPSGVDSSGVLEQLMAAVSLVEQPQQDSVGEVQAEQTVELVEQAFVDSDDRCITPTLIAPINENAPVVAPILSEDEELLNLYQTTSEERLQILQDGLQYLQTHPDDEATWEQLRREAHSLKGDSRSVGLEKVETLAHCIEEILLSLSRQRIVLTEPLSDRLFQGLGVISLLVHEAVTGEPSGVDPIGILDQLMLAVAKAEALPHETASTFIEDEELREIYKTTTQERLQKLEAGLLHLEKHPDDTTTLDQLLREAHSFKGDSRGVGLEAVETLIHQIEEILLSIKRQQIVLTPQVSDCLYQGLDAIEKLVHEALTGQPSRVDVALILNHLIEVVPVPTIQESQPVSPEADLLGEEIPVKATPQDLPSVGEPYNIDTIRVQTRDLDALMTQAEELTVTRISIAHSTAQIEELVNLWEDWKAFRRKRKNLDSPSSDTHAYEERLENMLDSLRMSAQENSSRLNFIAGELGEKIRTLRLLPLSTIFQQFPRMVRDLARGQSKQVEFIIEGGETTADKRILEGIKDSLTHMIRNCVDHGIETPDEREKLGKSPTATIWLRGYQSGNSIVIEVADDGRGLDIEKIRQTAIKRRLYSPEELDSMTPSQIHNLIFSSGFSTRTFITEISGRGIGLDVVRTNVERLKGTIQIESTLGKGCTFRLQLNTTLATINVMLVEIQGIIHALPVEFVQSTLLVSQDEITTLEGRETLIWNDQNVPVGNLADFLELSNSIVYDATATVERETSELKPCILLEVGEERAAFFVDRLLDTQEVVLKPRSQLLKRVRNVFGTTILGTGDVCMILNPPDLLKALQNPTVFALSIKQRTAPQRKPVILLVEDSIYVRTQEQRLLENAGYEVVIAVDGLDGYNKLRTRDFDAVLSDVEMPKLDGFSLTAKIRRHPEYRELPIILITTLDSDEDLKKGADAGADAYIIKGKFNQDFLLEILGKIV